MKFVFDANILIRSVRTDFNKDEFKSFLDWILNLINNGVIILPECVYNEISRGDDILAEWCEGDIKRLKIDDSLAAPFLQKVLEAYEAKDTKSIEKIQNDAFVVAHAIVCGGTVVTYEKESEAKSAKNKKIPSICKKLGISCITLPNFMWRFMGQHKPE